MDTIQYFLMYCPPQRKSSAEEWLEAQHSRATDDIAKYVVLSKSIFSPVLLLSLWKLLACVTDSGPRIKTFIKYVEISICDTINYTAKMLCLCTAQSSGKWVFPCFQLQRKPLLPFLILSHMIFFYIDSV